MQKQHIGYIIDEVYVIVEEILKQSWEKSSVHKAELDDLLGLMA
ncbi:MAG: hypothetical protein PUK63_07755 [Clostridiales bacterium]|nr:hypothetical protein [Clostridiales bacterium]MDY3062337.1 hypothetical protein [Eubacteriales bacterium]